MTAATTTWPHLEDVVDEIRGILADARTIACLAHKDADADSLGSALGFALSLRELGRDVQVLVPSPLPRMLEYLPGFDTITETAGEGVDALFTFDCATVARFGDKRDLIGTTPTVVNVDHHVSNEGFGTVNLIEPTASATGQVVHRLLRNLGAPITADVATNLYAALFTDTGGFRHENTTEAALRLGADLVAAGCNPGWVALKSYKSRSVPQLKLEGLAVARLHTEMDGRLIWSEITQAMLDEAGADMMESEGVIDQLQSIDTMAIAILFKESAPGMTKVSVRTRDPYDATAVCRPFGGGGHHRAAGAEVHEPLAVFEPRVLEVARGLLRSSG
ncbi:MAG TPA: DHH family phosphoesterase [Candidatus Dormibacteraeota bacterium]|jgi:phosphoesterase RecJ-like protein|nr:DHH family phosphoesterase [Candidatus Dormibacteraeota bacterium]